MRFGTASLVLVCLIPFAASTTATSETTALARDDPAIRELLTKAAAEIKGQAIYDCINEVTTSGVTAYRLMGSPNRDLFVERYAHVFSKISPRIKDQVVTFNQGNLPAGVGPASPTGKNIIGVLPGKDLTKWVVLGGHYDTQAPTTGAIDNTSGICVVQELAKAIVALDVEPEATFVFAWWDGEEWGLYGSRSFVRDPSKTADLLGLETENVRLMVGESYDIVGINYPAYNTWVGYGERTNVLDEYATLNLRMSPTDENRPMLGEYRRLMGRDDKDQILLNNSRWEGLVKEINFRLLGRPERWVSVHQDNYGRSDHQPFIGAGVPGMRIQGSHDYEQWPHYHLPSDTLATAAAMAGGQDRLVAGFESAAEGGGLPAIYVGITGGYGDYSNRTDAKQGLQLPATMAGAPANEASAIAAPAAMLALGAVLLLRRRGGR